MQVRTPGEIEKTELQAVLASDAFSKSPSLAKMLEYIGKKCLEGQEDSVKEYNIGVEAFGRPPDFDPKADSIVRVEAHRLREKLKRYYETEGADHAFVIVLPVGRYVPQFLPRPEGSIPPSPIPDLNEPKNPLGEDRSREVIPKAAQPAGAQTPPATMTPGFSRGNAGGNPRRRRAKSLWLGLAAVSIAAIITGIGNRWRLKSRRSAPGSNLSLAAMAMSPASASLAEHEVRMLAGFSKKEYVDRQGDIWGPDRFFDHGQPLVEPPGFYARAADPTLFETAREGEFTYDVPLKPGTYELQLYFVETDYGPGMIRGGGETSRMFNVQLNGRPLLTNFDIYSDAGGDFTGDERVFKDVSPASDGYLHLKFVKLVDYPILNALEIVPGPPGKILPVRIVAQDHSYTDESGNLWMPDRYFLGGREVAHGAPIQGTPDPGLYASERYGNFSYAIPVAEGRYAVTLYLAETYFGPDNPGKGGVGSRIFDVDCNGVTLLHDLDIYREVGGDNRPLIKTFHGLRPNAQGKLLLSFVPVVNYASVRAIEVIDESP